MRHYRSWWCGCGEVECQAWVNRRSSGLTLKQTISAKAAFVLGSNISGLVLKIDVPFLRCRHNWRRLYGRVDKVQPYATLADPARLLAILAGRCALVAFEMSFSTRQASCPHSFRLIRCGNGLRHGGSVHLFSSRHPVHLLPAASGIRYVCSACLFRFLRWSGIQVRSIAPLLGKAQVIVTDKREIGSRGGRDASVLGIREWISGVQHWLQERHFLKCRRHD